MVKLAGKTPNIHPFSQLGVLEPIPLQKKKNIKNPINFPRFRLEKMAQHEDLWQLKKLLRPPQILPNGKPSPLPPELKGRKKSIWILGPVTQRKGRGLYKKCLENWGESSKTLPNYEGILILDTFSSIAPFQAPASFRDFTYKNVMPSWWWLHPRWEGG